MGGRRIESVGCSGGCGRAGVTCALFSVPFPVWQCRTYKLWAANDWSGSVSVLVHCDVRKCGRVACGALVGYTLLLHSSVSGCVRCWLASWGVSVFEVLRKCSRVV